MNQGELNFNRRSAAEAPAEVVEKIKKLLRMERGGTAGEVDNALRLARQIADKHNIDLQSVDQAENSPFATLTHKAVRISMRSDDDEYSSLIVAKFFNVDTVLSSYFCPRALDNVRDLVIVGTEIDVQIAEYVFGFLRAHFKTCWRRRNKRLRDRKAFAYGLMIGILSKLSEGRDIDVPTGSAKSALVLSREAYKKKLFPEITSSEVNKPKKLSDAAKNAGYGMGRMTNIRQPLAGAPGAARPLALNDR